MARRIRWQIVVAVLSALLVVGLLGNLALSTTAVSQPLVGGTYSEAVPGGAPAQPVPLFNDPLADPAGRDVGALLFDGLTRLNANGDPVGALAADWQVDPAGDVYIFQLREDVTWHDGEPFTADDVIFTVQAVQDPDFAGDPSLAALWGSVLVDRLDDYTVRFTLDAPFAPFLAAARLPILPQHVLGTVPIDEWLTSDFAQQPVGTGPYRLERLSGERALLAAHPDYYLGRPFIDQLELRFVDAPQALLPQLAQGDLLALGTSTARTPALAQADLPRTLRRLTLPMDEYAVLTFNLDEPPLDDVALRRALAHGLNKDQLVEQVHGGHVARLDTPILRGWPGYDPTLSWYAHDVLTATQTLRQRGYADLSLPLLTDSDPGRLAAANEIARQWGELGVRVEVIELERDELRERLRARDFTLAVHGWARLGADPDVFELWHSSQADDGLNYAGLEDAQIDTALERGRTVRERAARTEAYTTFQRRWIDQVPAITLYQPLYTFVVSDEVGGLWFDEASLGGGALLVGREDRYRNVSAWFVNSSRQIRGTLR
jgi:peptide/nickel transport system substrate-binding protein